MLPWLDELWGNPSAGYRFGRQARNAIAESREKVAALIGANPSEIIFTSGGTESNNTIIQSALASFPDQVGILTSTVEHSAVEEVAKAYDQTGYSHRPNPVDSEGHLDLAQWESNVAAGDLAIASLIWANNETGVLSPIEEAAAIAEKHDVFFHTDAVQAVGKIPVSVAELPIHALSLSAHKFHGPKGIGALYVNRNTRYTPLILGGGQEENRRSGTENVAGIVGLGVAAELAQSRLQEQENIARLRDQFEAEVVNRVDGVKINGDPFARIPNTSNLYFPGVDGEGLLILLDEAGVCCSPGSACSTGSVQPSRIVKAMGHSSERARSSVRFSISRFTTSDEIEEAVDSIVSAVGKLRITMPSGGGVISSSAS